MKQSRVLFLCLCVCCGLTARPAAPEQPTAARLVHHDYTDSTALICIEGLQDTLRILQITDTHISVVDSSERKFWRYSRRMDQAFITRPDGRTGEPARPVDQFLQLLDKAKSLKVDLIALTGDIVNNPSRSSVAFVQAALQKCGIPYLYTAGNHDWHYEGMKGSSAQLRKTWIKKRLQPLYGRRNPFFHAHEIKGIQVVAIDNSTYQILPEQLAFFQQILKQGLPVVLLSHIPYYVAGDPRKAGCGNPDWGWDQDKSYELERRQRWPKSGNSPATVEFINTLPAADNLAAVLTGHHHKSRATRLSATAVQYVTAAGFSGGSRLITLTPQRRLPISVSEAADGWSCEEIARVDQSYAGWDVEIGDADNDGLNEILTTGCPHSRLYLFEKSRDHWVSRCLADNLAQSFPGMGLAVKVRDLDGDGRNEIVLGTGQETGGTAFLYLLGLQGDSLNTLAVCRAECNASSYTHDLAFHDLDQDGFEEVVSAYCGGGEIIRYDVDPSLTLIRARKLHQLSGSGEESLIADVDNDGQMEYITCNAFRDEQASVEIFEFDAAGDLLLPPRVVLNGFDGQKCFYASAVVGDVDNDGKNDLVVGWKRKQHINRATVLAYHVAEQAVVTCVFAEEDEDLDLAYFEKMMAIDDVDHDGLNELLLSTRGDEMSEKITSRHLGYVFMYKVMDGGAVVRTRLLDLNEDYAESSWLAVGDADNDGKKEIILATGKGDRTQPGAAYVLLLRKN
ncbi:MAG TPA: FG-GAP-like repeat-containing protein [bacterium]|nr:FG-GAP-like repeat-containing protein [bacterium]